MKKIKLTKLRKTTYKRKNFGKTRIQIRKELCDPNTAGANKAVVNSLLFKYPTVSSIKLAELLSKKGIAISPITLRTKKNRWIKEGLLVISKNRTNLYKEIPELVKEVELTDMAKLKKFLLESEGKKNFKEIARETNVNNEAKVAGAVKTLRKEANLMHQQLADMRNKLKELKKVNASSEEIKGLEDKIKRFNWGHKTKEGFERSIEDFELKNKKQGRKTNSIPELSERQQNRLENVKLDITNAIRITKRKYKWNPETSAEFTGEVNRLMPSWIIGHEKYEAKCKKEKIPKNRIRSLKNHIYEKVKKIALGFLIKIMSRTHGLKFKQSQNLIALLRQLRERRIDIRKTDLKNIDLKEIVNAVRKYKSYSKLTLIEAEHLLENHQAYLLRLTNNSFERRDT